MTWPAFILIVLSAGLHASWNLVAKKNRISLPFYALICSVGAVCCFNIHFWTPVPVRELSLKFWGSVLGSTWSDIFYCLGLVYCYRKLEMASAYPVMRALPIILTAIVTTIFGLGKSLTRSAVPGFLIVFAGALMMPLEHFRDFKFSTYLNPSLLFILAAGGVIFWLTAVFEPLPRAMSQLALPASFITMVTGLFIIIARRKAITQVIGFLLFENGISIFGTGMMLEHGLLVELGILLDVLVLVFIMGIALFQISREFQHIDSDRLNQLDDHNNMFCTDDDIQEVEE